MCRDANARYHADRATAEAVRAIAADCEPAAAAHHELCLRYSGRMIAALVLLDAPVQVGRR